MVVSRVHFDPPDPRAHDPVPVTIPFVVVTQVAVPAVVPVLLLIVSAERLRAKVPLLFPGLILMLPVVEPPRVRV